ncbi:MAG TPA: lytic transglycosylase domain-containing protein [Bryobacteraceae bacterium]|jgi:soluble lytic murein transglycosylase-like protein|nr:lytic transglycosylase domain-containing protein [Bryobacteraceae bacterium]
MYRLFYLIGLQIGLIALTAPLWAGEYVVLENGFRIHADRHEVDGPTVRLFNQGGVAEMPAASIAGYESEEAAPAPLPAPQAAQPAEQPAPQQPATPSILAAGAARKFALPESFVQSVMRAESGFNPAAISPKGATGLMQLMPDTARQLGVDPKDPRQNAEGGAQYLRDLLALYENRPDQVLLALAAYNAGPGAVEKYHGVPPYLETRQYILRVLKNWDPALLAKPLQNQQKSELVNK